MIEFQKVHRNASEIEIFLNFIVNQSINGLLSIAA